MSDASVEEYLEVALLAEGQSKTDLEALLASVDEHNKDYVMKYLKSDCEAYVSTHVSADLRKSDAVVTSVRQDFGLKYFNIILADYQAMSKFVQRSELQLRKGCRRRKLRRCSARCAQTPWSCLSKIWNLI